MKVVLSLLLGFVDFFAGLYRFGFGSILGYLEVGLICGIIVCVINIYTESITWEDLKSLSEEKAQLAIAGFVSGALFWPFFLLFIPLLFFTTIAVGIATLMWGIVRYIKNKMGMDTPTESKEEI